MTAGGSGGGMGGGGSTRAVGASCTLDAQCITNHCVTGVCCTTACTNGCEACLFASTGVLDGSCSPTTAGTVCRIAAPDPCDVAETCNGSSTACPIDGFASAQTRCGFATDAGCDLDDFCTGTSTGCPDRIANGNTVCRPSAGLCDVAEQCTGASPACPPNGFASAASTACAPFACPGNGPDCRTSCNSTADCAPTPRAICVAGATCLNAKFAFVSSQIFNSGMGPGLAQTICTNAGAMLGGTYLPFLSSGTAGANPAAAFPAGSGPWIRPGDKLLVAAGKNDLLDGTIINPISRNEFGTNAGGMQVWTGTGTNGMPVNHCNSWTGLNGSNGTTGVTTSSGAPWTQDSNIIGCLSALPVYCFQTD